MQDRVSLYPGRVKLVPVSGQENTYDMVRADSPTQEGTPLNKDSLLKDATAALYGLDETAVPDDVLVALKNLIDGLNGVVSGLPQIETGSYTGTGYNVSSTGSSVTLNFQHNPFAVFITTTNKNPQTQVLVRGSAYAGGDVAESGNTTTTLAWGEKSLTIANSYYGAAHCFNESGKTYYYYAMYISD